MKLTDVIRRPLITEKTSLLREDGRTIVFEVATGANKIEVKRAIEQLLGAKVDSIRTSISHGKVKRQGRFAGQPKFLTWTGGFSFAIPTGARHTQEAWRFVRYMESEEAVLINCRAQKAYNESKGRPYVFDLRANQRINQTLLRTFPPVSPRLVTAQRAFIDMLPFARYRPVTFIGQTLWDAHVRSFERATSHAQTPKAVLTEQQALVQKALDLAVAREALPLLPVAPYRLTHGADLAYFPEGAQHFDDYVEAVGWAQDYARANREEMMELVLDGMRRHLPAFEVTGAAVNCHHNYVERETHFGEQVWLTRKGAIRAGGGELGIIPGSMGARSFIVRGKGSEESFHSCAHGAGRRMSRKEAGRRFTTDDLVRQTDGVVCRKDHGVLDEIPGAYKDIDEVMANQSDLVEVVHTLKQVLCVKG